MSPKVSVIIPVYNVSEYLGQCLDSVLLQTLQDIEVICVDDGSTDDSLDILQGYAMFDERLKIISQENAGAGAARNNGIKHATGEYIICLDSDDFFEPDMLEKMVAKAEEDGSDVVVCGHYAYDNTQQKVTHINLIHQKYLSKNHWNTTDFQNDLFTFCTPAPWNKLIRHSIIKQNNLYFDEHAHADDLMFHCLILAVSKKISTLKNAFTYYRINTRGQQSQNKKNAVQDVLKTLTLAYNNLKKIKRYENNKNSLLNRIKRTLQFELSHYKPDKKQNALLSIQQILPNELYSLLFLPNNQPAVSIIVPVYNAAPFLPECLDSCLNQTLKEIEIICVDDGSTDNSLEILNAYAKKDNRIKVIHQENQGLPITRNNALKIATGEYIQYLDSDDFLLPESCECLYLYAKIFDLEMLFFTARDFQNQTNETEDIPYHQLSWLPDNFISVFSWQNVKEVMQLVAVTACLTFYKHSFLKEHNIHWINQKICYEDSPYFVEAFLQAQRVGALKENFYQRRLHGQNITQRMDSNFPDYCKVSYLTLKIAKQYADDIAFFRLFHGYTLKAYNIYKELSKQSQQKFKRKLLKLYSSIYLDYDLDLSDEIKKWCIRNVNKKYHSTLPIKKWQQAFQTKKLQHQENLSKWNDVILGKHNTISDNTMKNIKNIFNSSCIFSWNGDYIKMLFKNSLVFQNNNDKISDYTVFWGSDPWFPQPNTISWAIQNNIPIIRAEDGFLRSADTWCNTNVDKKYTNGISFTFSNDVHYFDATTSSFIERLINDKNLLFSEEQLNRSKQCIDFITNNYLTKYNHQPIYTPNIGRKNVKKILVVDQSYGDYSIKKGLADENTFQLMLETAINENPEADIIIKTHPDTLTKNTNRPTGYYSHYKEHDNIYLLTNPINPIALLKYCDKVYVCTSQFGFEALMCKKEVHVFGMPFYAGWGLTHDKQKCERRTNKRSLEELFYIAYIMYSHYVNPQTQKECEIEEAMNYLLQLRNEYFELLRETQ